MKKLASIVGIFLALLSLAIGTSLWEPHSAVVRARIISGSALLIGILLIVYGQSKNTSGAKAD